MHYSNNIDEQAKTSILKRNIKPVERQKHIKLIVYYTKFKTSSNLIVNNNTNSAKSKTFQLNVLKRNAENVPTDNFKTKRYK